jgi:hypothetical protein
MCAACGDTAIVEIEKKTGKILDPNWWYWGKIHNPDRDKYLYTVADRDDPSVTLDNPRKELNPSYNPKAPKYLGEYWECKACYSKPMPKRKKKKSSGKPKWNVAMTPAVLQCLG